MMKGTGVMTEDMKNIQGIENKYGPMLFGMGLIQLVDVGHSNITEAYVEESIAQITTNGKVSIMTPEFQCGIIQCAGELAKFSPMTLFRYIKKYMHIAD